MLGLLKNFFQFVFAIFQDRQLLVGLTRRDFRSRYLGSYLGLAWAFIHPCVIILVFWFVFELGFKSKPVGNFPFILWLITGIIPWFFFSDALATAGNSILEYRYLVQKMVFRVSILPIVKILSALVIHLFFIGIIFGFFKVYGYEASLYNLQVIYYLFAMIVLLLGLCWLTSALAVFLKDVEHIIGVFLQFGFWMTPIFWSINMLPARYHFYLKLNPIYYLVQGFRDAFIHKIWFWERMSYTLYFWGVTVVIFVGGAVVFRKLKPHFADVL